MQTAERLENILMKFDGFEENLSTPKRLGGTSYSPRDRLGALAQRMAKRFQKYSASVIDIGEKLNASAGLAKATDRKGKANGEGYHDFADLDKPWPWQIPCVGYYEPCNAVSSALRCAMSIISSGSMEKCNKGRSYSLQTGPVMWKSCRNENAKAMRLRVRRNRNRGLGGANHLGY